MAKSTKPLSKPLTPKQQRFVTEYLIDLNGTQAAIRSGYSRKGAEVQANRLLRNAGIAAAVEQGKKDRLADVEFDQVRVLHETALLAFSDVTHYDVDDEGNISLTADAPKDAMRAIASIKRRIITSGSGDRERTERVVEIRLWDKPGPLRLAGRHVGLFPDKVELVGKDGESLTFTLDLNVRDRDA